MKNDMTQVETLANMANELECQLECTTTELDNTCKVLHTHTHKHTHTHTHTLECTTTELDKTCKVLQKECACKCAHKQHKYSTYIPTCLRIYSLHT